MSENPKMVNIKFDFCHTLRLEITSKILSLRGVLRKHPTVFSVLSAEQMCMHDSIIFKIKEILLKEFSIILLNVKGGIK